MKHFEAKQIQDPNFDSTYAMNLPVNKRFESFFIHLRSNKGQPVYTTYYKFFQTYLALKIDELNSRLRKVYPLNYCKSGGLLDLNTPAVRHYAQRFPEEQFKVYVNQKPEFILKPSCCGHAFSVWASKKKSLLKKEILHQVSDCYRIEKTGTVRSLSRNSYFTMPDYHMVSVKDQVLEDFKKIRFELIKFFENLIGDLSNFTQITRFVNLDGSFQKEDLLKHQKNTKDCYYQVLQFQEKELPYFTLKWQLSYRGSSKLYTLATVQLDPTYPKIFGLDETVYGPRVALHFTVGSIPRLIQTMILENKIPQRGVKVKFHTKDTVEPLFEELLKDLNPFCGVLLDDNSNNLSESVSFVNDLERYFFPILLIVGPKELETGTVQVLDRTTRQQVSVGRKHVSSLLKEKNLINSFEIYFRSTLK